MLKRSLVVFSLSVGMVVISACSNPSVDSTGGGSTPTNPANLQCAVSLGNSSGTATSGVPVPLLVTILNGTPNYSIDGQGSYTGSTSINYTFFNSSSSSTLQTKTVTVTDSLSRQTSCSVQVTVLPASGGSSLACDFQVSPSSPRVNQTVTGTLTASGGTAPYTFSALTPGTNASIVSNLAPVTSSVSQAQWKYTSAGLKNASATLQDSLGATVQCNQVVTVRTIGLSLVASPSTSVPSNQTISVSAIYSGFLHTPTITFASSNTSVQLVSATSSTTASSPSQTAQGTYVTAVATDSVNGDSAQASIYISFTSLPPVLGCTVSTSSNPARMNTWFLLSARVTSWSTPVGSVKITKIETGTGVTVYWGGWLGTSQLDGYLAYADCGTFPIRVTIQDSVGTTATCSTTQYIVR